MTGIGTSAPIDRIVLLHGFTQTALSWTRVADLLRERLPGIEIEALDLPGHGHAEAPADDDLWATANRVADIGGRAMYVGYSMGGRVALHLALARPQSVPFLVLIGATAGIDDEDERRSRRTDDERLAAHIEDVGIATFVDEWLRQPLFAGLDDDSAMRQDRLRNRAPDLAASLRATGTGTQAPLWSRLREIACPTLVLAGEHDAKFAAVGRRLADGITDSELRLVAAAGHSAHLEQPSATVDAIVEWLSARPRATTD